MAERIASRLLHWPANHVPTPRNPMHHRPANNVMLTRQNLRWATRAMLSVAFLLLMAGVASACPTCKDGIAGDPASAGAVKGYFWSILFMMSMPFLILSSLGAYFYLQVRKARAAGGSQPPLPTPNLPADLTADWT